MFAIRCTKKLLARGAPDVLEAPRPPTTLLGDWYANLVVCRPEHLVVCISERTLLPVVVTAKNIKGLSERLTAELALVLKCLSIPEPQIEAERQAMQGGYLAVTASRKILGSLNEAVFHLEHSYRKHPEWSRTQHAIWLAEIPSGAMEFAFPSEASRSLFAASKIVGSASGAA